MKIGENSIKYQGKQLVSINEFAERKGTTKQNIQRLIKQGDLVVTKPNGYNIRYLDWDTQSIAYDTRKKKPRKNNSNLVKLDEEKIKKPKLTGVDKVKLPDIITPNTETMTNLGEIDPDDHPDCWYFDAEGQPIHNPQTGKKMLDYDKLKIKLISQKYQFDLDKDRGKYVEKDSLIRASKGISKIIASYIESIPQRYASIIIATMAQITDHEFNQDEEALIRNLLVDTGKNTLESMRQEFLKIIED